MLRKEGSGRNELAQPRRGGDINPGERSDKYYGKQIEPVCFSTLSAPLRFVVSDPLCKERYQKVIQALKVAISSLSG